MIYKHICLSTNTWFFSIKKYKGTDYVLSWKQNEIFNSKLKPSFTAFLNSIKLSEYRMGIKLDEDPLAVEQKNCLTKNLNVYM